MNSNSRKDPSMIEAVNKLRTLLNDIADAAELARDEYRLNPRNCGIPKNVSLLMKEDMWYYPHTWIINFWRTEANRTLWRPSNESEAVKYHESMIDAFIQMFRDGIPAIGWSRNEEDHTISALNESPRKYLDRIRGVLRHEYRLDSDSMLTRTFALLRCIEEKPSMKRGFDDLSTAMPTFSPLPEIELQCFPHINNLSIAMKRAFDHTAISLLPKRLTTRQHMFLQWICARGGKCRQFELISWLKEDRARGLPSRGQGFERILLRTFCEKDTKGTRTDWTIRPESIALLNSI